METGALSDYEEEMEMAAAIVGSDERIAAAYYCIFSDSFIWITLSLDYLKDSVKRFKLS